MAGAEPRVGGALMTGLDVLEALGSAHGPIGLSELARTLKADNGHVHRLLGVLTKRGYVHRDEANKTYTLGAGVVQLAGSLLRNMDIVAQARPLMLDLMNMTGESVHLAHRTITGGVYIARERLARKITVETEIGSPVVVHATSTGKALYCRDSAETLSDVVDLDTLERFTEHTITDRPGLLRDSGGNRRARLRARQRGAQHRCPLRGVAGGGHRRAHPRLHRHLGPDDAPRLRDDRKMRCVGVHGGQDPDGAVGGRVGLPAAVVRSRRPGMSDAPEAGSVNGSTRSTAVRDRHLERLTTQDHDALIVGGGINGAISALALATHGLRVALIDSEDFASGVSQESSNLIWGGFKYLQTYDVALVAGLCRSRNLLARSYASRVREVRFLAALGPTSPYSPAYAALGAHAYWALGRFATGRPRLFGPRSLATAEPAIDSDDVQGAVEYSDYLLADNDARFVLQLLLDAVDNGAVTVSRMRLDGAARDGDAWRAELTDRLTGDRHAVEAGVLVNAAGPRGH